MPQDIFAGEPPPLLDRSLDSRAQPVSRIGEGEIGGKASGLMSARRLLETEFPADLHQLADIEVPIFVVLTTEVFDAFVEQGDLREVVTSGIPDDRIAHAFQQADFPVRFAGDLRAVLERISSPIAVRSSSMLEDRLAHPFAGVYETKMIPNNQPDAGERFVKLVEAVKYVYASMFFKGAVNYLRSASRTLDEEKMAVVLQEVVGIRHDRRFYPHVSGVVKSYNYYAFGRARPEDGVASLALGLGKTIVDGGVSWSYCPAFPTLKPPFASPRDQLRGTQNRFWAVNLGAPPEYDPISETEYMEQHELSDADYDGVLGNVASTYEPAGDRLVPGVRGNAPRVVNFAPTLEYGAFPLNKLVRALMEACERAYGADVEIELALTFPVGRVPRARLGFLQVRPMAGIGEQVRVPETPPAGWATLVGSERAMGNGILEDVADVIYVRPDRFELKDSGAVAMDIEGMNQRLLDEGRRCLLIGFGRWGSSDPWLGIPVTWSQICAARTVVEATLDAVRVEPSQGSHFFHNLSSFGVSYFTVSDGEEGIAWEQLAALPAIEETDLVRHVRFGQPVRVLVDGRSARGVIFYQQG